MSGGDRASARAARLLADVPDTVDIRALRIRTGLSQTKFARRFGLDPRALQDWEQRRRLPDRTARVLLAVIAHEPAAVERALAAARAGRSGAE
jgi:putative transcriptional regulator